MMELKIKCEHDRLYEPDQHLETSDANISQREINIAQLTVHEKCHFKCKISCNSPKHGSDDLPGERENSYPNTGNCDQLQKTVELIMCKCYSGNTNIHTHMTYILCLVNPV